MNHYSTNPTPEVDANYISSVFSSFLGIVEIYATQESFTGAPYLNIGMIYNSKITNIDDLNSAINTMENNFERNRKRIIINLEPEDMERGSGVIIYHKKEEPI